MVLSMALLHSEGGHMRILADQYALNDLCRLRLCENTDGNVIAIEMPCKTAKPYMLDKQDFSDTIIINL